MSMSFNPSDLGNDPQAALQAILADSCRDLFSAYGIDVTSGSSPDGLLVEFVELPASMHPFFVATQAHPEFKSRPNRPHPLFAAFVEAARQRAEGRAPRLPIPTEASNGGMGDRGVAALPR